MIMLDTDESDEIEYTLLLKVINTDKAIKKAQPLKYSGKSHKPKTYLNVMFLI